MLKFLRKETLPVLILYYTEARSCHLPKRDTSSTSLLLQRSTILPSSNTRHFQSLPIFSCSEAASFRHPTFGTSNNYFVLHTNKHYLIDHLIPLNPELPEALRTHSQPDCLGAPSHLPTSEATLNPQLPQAWRAHCLAASEPQTTFQPLKLIPKP